MYICGMYVCGIFMSVCVVCVCVCVWCMYVLKVGITILLPKIVKTSVSISMSFTFNLWTFLVNFMTDV